MKVKLTKDCEGPEGLQPAGTMIEHPDAHRLVALGVAEPVDDEAKAKADERAAEVAKEQAAKAARLEQIARDAAVQKATAASK